MKFCSECTSPLNIEIPEGDTLARHVCSNCKTIHYLNPKVITGTLPVLSGRIMLCKRGIEPRAGFWTLPGGFMENEESLADGALRETWEETRTKPILRQLLSTVSIPAISQIHCFYLADMESDHFKLTPESVEIKFFDIEDIPWDDLAFKSVKLSIQHFIEHFHHYETKQSIPLLDTSLDLPKKGR